MAPEQIRSARDVDARCDIWALGVILFELLTGKRPFESENAPEVLRAILEADPPRVRDMRPEVPPQIEAIVMRCLQKDRDARFGAVKELVLALERALKESGIERTEIWWPTGSLETLPSLEVDVAPSSTHDGAPPAVTRGIDAPSIARIPTTTAQKPKRKKKKKKKRTSPSASAEAAAEGPVAARAEAPPETTVPAPEPVAWVPAWSLALVAACVVAAWIAGSRWGRGGAPADAASTPPPATSTELAHVTIEVRPRTATLVVDGRPVPNPFTGDVPRDRTSHGVVASAPGYVPETRDVGFDRDLVLSIGLAPEPASSSSGLASSPSPIR
jgi:serine/threonine-protein kinase